MARFTLLSRTAARLSLSRYIGLGEASPHLLFSCRLNVWRCTWKGLVGFVGFRLELLQVLWAIWVSPSGDFRTASTGMTSRSSSQEVSDKGNHLRVLGFESQDLDTTSPCTHWHMHQKPDVSKVAWPVSSSAPGTPQNQTSVVLSISAHKVARPAVFSVLLKVSLTRSPTETRTDVKPTGQTLYPKRDMLCTSYMCFAQLELTGDDLEQGDGDLLCRVFSAAIIYQGTWFI